MGRSLGNTFERDVSPSSARDAGDIGTPQRTPQQTSIEQKRRFAEHAAHVPDTLRAPDKASADAALTKLMRDLPDQPPRTEPHKTERRIHVHRLSPAHLPGYGSCTANCGSSSAVEFQDASAELEYTMWGACEDCQVYSFPTLTRSAEQLIREIPQVKVVAGGPFGELSPLSPIPVAYPDRQMVWSSPYHLFISHHFLEPRLRAIVAQAPLGFSAFGLRSLLNVPKLQAGVRDDWSSGWALRAMRHAIFSAIDQHPALARLLLGTRNAPIVFSGGEHESFWGAASYRDGAVRGENVVGKILVEKRRLLIAGAAATGDRSPRGGGGFTAFASYSPARSRSPRG